LQSQDLMTSWLQWKHPNIWERFYEKLKPPTGVDDAFIKMNCHNHAVDDCNLQLEINELEASMLYDGDELPMYHVNTMEELEHKKLKLLQSKRYHQNAARAYWYYMVQADK
jgi:hypothetical protein